MLQTWIQRLTRQLSKRYFYKLIGLGLLSVVVPIILISFSSYKITVTNLNEQNMKSRLVMLGQLQSRVDERLESAKNALYTLVFDPDIEQAVHADSSLKPQLLLNVQKKLAGLHQSISESHGVSIYFVNSGTVLFHDRYMNIADRDWAAGFPEYGPIDEWKYQEGQDFKVVTYTIGLPAFSAEPNAYLSIHLRQDAFLDILSNVEWIEASDVYFLDHAYHPIIHKRHNRIDDQQRAAAIDWIRKNEKMNDIWRNNSADVSVQYFRSEKTNWMTVLMIPISAESAFTKDIVWLTFVISFIALAAGVIITYLNSKHLYAPIDQWLKEENFIYDDNSKDDEWTWLQTRWRTLKEDLKKQEPELRKSFLLSWLAGSHSGSREQQELLLKKYRIPSPRKCLVFIVDANYYWEHSRFGKEDELLVHQSMANLFYELLEQKYLEGDIIKRPETYQSICVVYVPQHVTDQEADQRIKQFAQTFQSSIEMYLKIPATISLGGLRQSVHEIRHSYEEAKEALQYRIIKENESILDIQHVRKGNGWFQYPFDISDKIVKELRSGNKEEVKNHFNTFVEIVRNHHYPDRAYRHIFLMLYDATLQGFYRYPEEAVATLWNQKGHEAILSAQFFTEIVQWFWDQWFPLCFEVIERENESKGKQVIETVKQYIADTFDQDLSLQHVAEQVNLNPSYLSRLFRKETGQTFVNYVAQYRIEKAKHMLKDSDEPIYKIAEAVGYTEQTFRRVFKNMHGMSPNEYRLSVLQDE